MKIFCSHFGTMYTVFLKALKLHGENTINKNKNHPVSFHQIASMEVLRSLNIRKI